MRVAHKWLLYITLLWTIATLLPSKIDGACVCNEKGTDYCAGCSELKVVRPKQKYVDGTPEIDLSPIGDKCWCTKKMIEPAVLPKPCTHKKPSCGCKSSSYSPPSSYDSLPSIFAAAPYSSYVPQDKYVSTILKDDSPPADPISVSLAIQAGKAIEVPEAKLAYGFFKNPIDDQPKIYVSSVKEENLYALKNDVITLKKKTSVKKPDEDYVEPEEEDPNEQKGDIEDDDPPALTYKQLGYVAEQYKNPTFQEVAPSYVSTSASSYNSEPSVVRGKVSVDCGYKPGRIAPYRRVRHHSDLDSCFEKS